MLNNKRIKLVLIRHGETHGNRARVCQGQTHGELTEDGISQAEDVGNILKNEHFDVCFSSDLKRAHDTCKIIVNSHKLNILTDVRLRERFFGELENTVMGEDWDSFADHESAETISNMRIRASDFISEIISKYKDKSILVVSHGAFLKVLLSVALGMEISDLPDIKNCAITTLESEGKIPFKIHYL